MLLRGWTHVTSASFDRERLLTPTFIMAEIADISQALGDFMLKGYVRYQHFLIISCH